MAVAVPTSAPGMRLALNASAPKHHLPPGKVKSVARSLAAAANELGNSLI